MLYYQSFGLTRKLYKSQLATIPVKHKCAIKNTWIDTNIILLIYG